MAVEMFSVEWANEDELPEEMDDAEYDLCYVHSKLIDGVRKFPFVRDWNYQNDCERIVYLGA